MQQIPYAVSLTGSRVSEIPVPKITLQKARSTLMLPDDVQVHSGFLNMYQGMRAQLIRTLQPYLNVAPVFITGHSLGAAVASLCTLDLSTNGGFQDLRGYTFGAPRAGNPAFANALNTGSGIQCFYQVVNMADIVFSVPLSVMPNAPNPDSPWLYEHGGKLMYFIENWGSWKNNHTMEIYIKNLASVVG